MNSTWTQQVAGSHILRWWHTPSNSHTKKDRSKLLHWTAAGATWIPWLVLAGFGVALFAAGASPLTIALCVGIASASYRFADVATALLLPVLVWSPKIPLHTWGGEPPYIRLDHAIVFGALLYVVANRRLNEGTPTRILTLFLLAAYASTALAFGLNGHAGLATPTLYLVQLLYLASIFILARSMPPRTPDLALYAWTLTVISIAAYGIVEKIIPLEIIDTPYRTYERLFFDGQSNHIAGFLTIAVLVGIVLLRQKRWRVLGAISATLSIAALASTGSREGPIALTAGLAMFILLRYPKTLIPMAAAFLLLLVLSPATFWYDLSAPGSSMSVRMLAWQEALAEFGSHPILGHGLATRDRSFYDNQYVLLLSETGLVGLTLFIAWILTLAQALYVRSKGSKLGASQSVAALAALVAVSIQGLAAVCLLITTIAGPLYWLAGTSLAMTDTSDVP